MGWRDRAQKVDSSSSSWKDRAKKVDTVSQTESGLRGAAQGATMGFSDEVVGAGKAIYDDLASLFSGANANKDGVTPEYDEYGRVSNPEELKGNYEEYRDEERDRNALAQKQNPGTYIAGNVAGSFALPGGGVKTAVTQGVASGVGYSEGENAQEIAQDAIESGAISGAFGGVLKGAGKAAGAIGRKADDIATSQATKSLNPTKSQMKNIERYGGVNKMGRRLLDEKLVKPFSSKKAMADRLQQRAAEVANEIDEMYAQAGGQGLPKEDLLDFLKAKVATLKEDAGDVPIAKKLSKYIDNIQESKREIYSPSDLRSLRGKVQKGINFNTSANKQQAAKTYRQSLRDVEMDELRDALGSEAKAQNQANFERYSQLARAKDVTEDAASREGSNNLFGLTSYITGAGAAGSGNLGLAAGAMAGREFLRRYGNQIGAVSANKMGKILSNPKWNNILTKAAERGPKSVAAQHFLLQKTDPKYRKALDDEDE